MNQDQVKFILLELRDDLPDFKLIFSGKSSRKVNGLYKPESMEIIIHNQNFSHDNELIYTAIHEFTHHVQFTSRQNTLRRYSKVHNSKFYALFYELLEKAEQLHYYQPEYDKQPELAELTRKIREEFIIPSGTLVKEMGRLLMEAQRLCRANGLRFEDYLDRVLSIPRLSASVMIKTAAYNLKEDLGYERMKVVAGINNPEQRESASEKMLQQMPIEKVKHQLKPVTPEDPVEKLEKERERIRHSIERLNGYLLQVEDEIKRLRK
ncbi:MAG: hypothetical protein KBA26_14570 [Candidatus Delongbacteria bacterium]|nr:hypothetical protein [Candidatus Delongbacteria bacterium]